MAHWIESLRANAGAHGFDPGLGRFHMLWDVRYSY